MFGKLILKSDTGVYISISHLGELYWNFGWAGVVFGMLAFGALLGYIGAKFNLEYGVTLTRVLMLLVAVRPFCIDFSGTMPISYSVWIRSAVAVGLLHLIFARKQPNPLASSAPGAAMGPAALPVVTPRFSNFLR
jgi:hypothetical protein